MRRIVCLGDSHASFFAGSDLIQNEYPALANNSIPNLEGIRLGAVLAYSLHKENSTNNGREKLFEIISNLNKDQVSILLCFGEIDCRFHILKQAEKQNINFEESVKNCVDHYFKVIKEVKDKGFDVLVWNVIPTSYLNSNPEYPHYGTHIQRNQCTQKFNEILKGYCASHQIAFIDIFNKLVTRSNFTKEYFLFDGVHLGQLAMPYFIKEINKYFPHIHLPRNSKTLWYYDLIKTYSLYKARKVKSGIKQLLKGT